METIVSSVVILFVLIFLGFFLGKKNIIRKEAAPDFSALVLQVAMPVTIFLSIIGTESTGTLGQSLLIMPAAMILHLGCFFLGLLVVRILRIPDGKQGCYVYTVMFSNNGFMGLPLALSIYGSEGLLLTTLANVVTNLLIFSVGVKILTKGVPDADPISIRKMFLTPINVSVVLGFIFYLAKIPIPEVAGDLLDYLANISSGLSMIVVGLSLSRWLIRDVFADWKMFVLAAVRLLAVPLLVIAVLAVLPIQMSPLMRSILILTSALPASAAQSMIVEQYHGDTRSSGQSVFLSTLFSVVTVPVIMLIGLR